METSCLSLLACPIDYLVVEPLWKKKLGVDYWKFLFRNLCLPRYPIGEQNLFPPPPPAYIEIFPEGESGVGPNDCFRNLILI